MDETSECLLWLFAKGVDLSSANNKLKQHLKLNGSTGEASI